MTSEIRVNKINNRSGLGTVTYSDTGIIVSGIVTATEISGLTALNVSGVGTANTLDINGDIDVDGHTNLDNVSIAGVTTASGDITITNTAPKLNLTDTNNNSDFRIKVESGQFDIDDTTSSNATRFRIYSNGEILIPNNVGFGVANPSEKVDVAGNIKVSGTIDANGDLDVDGHTNLDNINIAGMTTTTGNLYLDGGNINVGTGVTIKASGEATYAGIVTAGQGVRVPHGSATTNYISVGDNGSLRFWATGHSYGDIRSGNLHFRNNSLQNILEIQQDKDIFLYGPSYFLDTARFDSTVTIADSIIHFGDTDTKIRFPANDTISFETAGSERARITSAGSLMINKTSSFGSVPLQVKGTSSGLSDGGQIFDIGTAEGGSGTRIAFGVNEDNFSWIRSYESGVGGRDLVFAASEEKMRITSDNRVLIGRTASRMVGGSTTYAKLQIAGTSQSDSSISLVNNEPSTAAPFVFFGKTRGNSVGESGQVQNGDTLGGLSFIGADGTDTNNRSAEITAVVNGSPANNTIPTNLVFSTSAQNATQLAERFRIYYTNTGNGGIAKFTSPASGDMLNLQNETASGQGLILGVDTNNDYTYLKNNTSGTYSMVLNVNGSEKFRINPSGTITNTTTSSHSQGAGTFNIKGVINQYSQGSGSGLIFDCDFGRLTGYGDDTNVGNGTNLSGVLAHSTTDWTSSNSNTPISVNGGTFQYRVGFGGYFDCISNGGRVSVAAGSGSPNMASKLNTAAMTIEAWVWYDGDGREVIVSRYGSGFPNQFNMLCDPNGQFHYNNGGVGAGGGNVSGEHFPDKTWHHHLWQYESGVNRWYINGAFANSRSAGSSLAVSSNTGFAIASRADQMEDWRGKIALVRIYNRALSATEIKNHFELERGRFGV